MAERDNYPAIHFILRHGTTLAAGSAAAVLLGGIAAALAGAGWGWAVVGIAAAPIVYLMLRSYAEIVRVIEETLLPR
jgi:hypothetical protein